MTNKKIIIIALSLTIIHFVLTSLIGHYINVQVGTQIGKIVTEGLNEVYENKTGIAEEEAKRINQEMKARSNEIKERCRIPELIISLPAKPLLNSLLKAFRQDRMNKYIAKEISRDQFRTRGLITDYTANFVNSLSLGLLVYIMLRILKYKKEKITHASRGTR
jgi:hypothetical protein